MTSSNCTFWKLLSLVLFVILITIIIVYACKQIDRYNRSKDPKLKEISEAVFPILSSDNARKHPNLYKRLEGRHVAKEVNLFTGDKSYTLDKEDIFMCLYDENNEYYELNLLIYVFLHELAHVLCKSIGHTDEFHAIFEDLQNLAHEEGIFDKHAKIDSEYCKYNDPS